MKTPCTGLFKFYDTHGVPFEDISQHIEARQQTPAWGNLYWDARRAGWTHRRILARLGEAIGEVYGQPLRETVLRRLEALRDEEIPR